jgi:putative endonuclease
MSFPKKELGAKGEGIAVRFLKDRGYKIVERNYRIRLGEIDIIAEQGGDLVFIEVKTRTGLSYGTPFESVTMQKQKQLSKVALEYLSKQDDHNRAARFDVIGIKLKEGCDRSSLDADIELLQNAFDLC